ncbi:Large proline-rich protein bag6 [Taenia solium]|eukprot:TsM_001040500 transcript=TsM_001040500 gene=TsM_001040500
MFEVHVKTLDGESKTFQIEDDDYTVAAFKQRITEEMNIPIERQRLIFQGKVLIDDRKLKDCGVASNTIHLVPRPPPRANADVTTSSSGPSGSHQPPLNPSSFINFRQTMNSLFSTGPNFSPAGNMPSMHTDNSGNIDIEANISFGEMCNNHFRQLQRQTTQLLNALDGVSPSVSTTSTPSTNVDDRATAPIGASESALSTSSSISQRNTSPLNFQRLADMLAEQRQLWQRLGPHMDRWEAMLRAEHELRTRIRTSDPGRGEEASSDVAASDADATFDTAGVADIGSTATPMEQEQEQEQEQEPMDTSESSTSIDWSQRFFNQVSALLHLHAHMLHLLSDFYVISTNPQTDHPTTGPSDVSAPAPSPSPAPRAEVQAGSVSTTRPHRNRSLVINEPDSSILYAHINIEPTVVTIARPVVSLSRRDTEEPRGRRRSQSANPPSSAPSGADEHATSARSGIEAQGGGMSIPTAVVIETPVGRTAQAAILDHLIDSMSSRVTSHPRTPQQQQGEGQTAVPRGSHSRVRNTASSGNSQRSPASVLTGLLPSRHGDTFLPCNSRHFSGAPASAFHIPVRRRRSYVGPTSGDGASTPRRQSTGTASRRGRSAGAQIGVNSTTNTAPSTTSTYTPRPPYQNFLRSMATAVSSSGVNAELFNRTIGDVTNQLTQLVAHGIGSGFGAATAPTTSGSTTVGPFTWIINNPQNGGVQFIPPPQFFFHSTTGGNASPSEPGTRLSMLPGLLVDSLIRSMWSFIIELARGQLSPESLHVLVHSKTLSIPIANVDLDGWRNGSNFPFINRSDEISRIRSMVVALVDSLHIAAAERQEDGSNSVVRHAVDRVSPHMQRMLERNLDPHSFNVRPELVDLLLNGHASDEAVDNIPERDIVAWGTSLAVPLGVPPLDLRRSLHNFLTDSLSRQLPLWRDTGSHGVLGTIMLNSLNAIMLDLLGFCDLLVQRAVERLGLQLNSTTVSGSAGTQGADRVATFGHAMSFEPMLSMLRGFASSLREDGREREAMNLIQRGVDAIMREYHSSGVTRFIENRERMQSYLVTRPLPASSNASPSPPDASCVKVDVADDSDISEVYMDASEDTPLGPPSAGASITVPNNAATSAAGAEAIGTAALPEWDSDSASLPTDPLAPNPDSEWLASSDEFSLLSTPASFPPEWTTLVASDVAQMAVASSTAAITAGEGTSEGDDASFAARRLSDAYIAGMPSKRRRVMLERKQSLACSANQLFMNLLKEAMSLAPSPAAAAADPSTATAGDSEGPELRQPPPQHVSEAFRAYVCERLSHRLATDPDFDAKQHPAAKEAFGKRSRHGRQ